jgi:hypothetical protein
MDYLKLLDHANNFFSNQFWNDIGKYKKQWGKLH